MAVLYLMAGPAVAAETQIRYRTAPDARSCWASLRVKGIDEAMTGVTSKVGTQEQRMFTK